ncbi:MAG: hypothetical protein CMH64_00875 [Nanoarchaeota archaeon]|nr:hypothetical protein [Nanoarchaeota archaeon]|tara:strand:+ start:93 stop:608 length:516 start_codon:yes stop_codon:yes gene_type:complete
MKSLLFLVLVAAIFVSGCASSSPEIQEVNDVVQREVVDKKVDEVIEQHDSGDVMDKEVMEEIALMDKSKYITGGREGYDNAKVFFTQKAGKGFEVSVNGDEKQIEVGILTDQACATLDQGGEAEAISSKSGVDVKISSSDVQEEDRNVCIHVKAVDEGEIVAHIVVNELSF